MHALNPKRELWQFIPRLFDDTPAPETQNPANAYSPITIGSIADS